MIVNVKLCLEEKNALQFSEVLELLVLLKSFPYAEHEGYSRGLEVLGLDAPGREESLLVLHRGGRHYMGVQLDGEILPKASLTPDKQSLLFP